MTVVGLVCNFTTFNPWLIIWIFTEEKETSEKMAANYLYFETQKKQTKKGWLEKN